MISFRRGLHNRYLHNVYGVSDNEERQVTAANPAMSHDQLHQLESSENSSTKDDMVDVELEFEDNIDQIPEHLRVLRGLWDTSNAEEEEENGIRWDTDTVWDIPSSKKNSTWLSTYPASPMKIARLASMKI